MSEKAGGKKVAVVMPALNAEKTLATMVGEIPDGWVDEIIVVDDHSADRTVELARELGLNVVWHPHTAGYGANQKTCYMEALRHEADVVVMLHPDGQYEPSLIPDLIAPIVADGADLVLGSRMMVPGAAKEAGMPLYKRIANRFLTTIENRAMGTRLSDLHTGYRAYSKRLLHEVPFLRNAIDFSFDSEMLLQTAELGLEITEVPARTRYWEDASSIKLKPATIYGLKTLGAVAKLLVHRSGLARIRIFVRAGER